MPYSHQLRRLSWVAETLDLSIRTVYQRANADAIPGLVRIGNTWRVYEPDFWRGLGLPMPSSTESTTETEEEARATA